MAFNDGDPFDAANLATLAEDVKKLSATAMTLGGNIDTLSNSIVREINPRQILAGTTKPDKWNLVSGINLKNFSFDEEMKSKPRAVLLQTRVDGGSKVQTPVSVVYTSISKTGFEAHCYLPSKSIPTTIYLSYIAIAY